MTEQPLSEKGHVPKDCRVCELDSFTPIYFKSDVKQAIQKTLKELKEKYNKFGTIYPWIDTTFKQNFGDKLCH